MPDRIGDHDHDRITRLEDRVAAHEALVAEQLASRDKALEALAHEPKLSRDEFMHAHDALVGRVTALEQRLASATGTAQGRYAVIAMLAVGVSILSLIVLIVTHLGQ